MESLSNSNVRAINKKSHSISHVKKILEQPIIPIISLPIFASVSVFICCILYDHMLHTLLFADDQVVVGQDREDVEYMLRKLVNEYSLHGFKVNFNKECS